jgi:hypothetical protein
MRPRASLASRDRCSNFDMKISILTDIVTRNEFMILMFRETGCEYEGVIPRQSTWSWWRLDLWLQIKLASGYSSILQGSKGIVVVVDVWRCVLVESANIECSAHFCPKDGIRIHDVKQRINMSRRGVTINSKSPQQVPNSGLARIRGV